MFDFHKVAVNVYGIIYSGISTPTLLFFSKFVTAGLFRAANGSSTHEWHTGVLLILIYKFIYLYNIKAIKYAYNSSSDRPWELWKMYINHTSLVSQFGQFVKGTFSILQSMIPCWINRVGDRWNLTLKVLGPSYPGLTRSISRLLMTSLLASPRHQRPCFWLYKLCRPLSYTRKDLNSLCYVSVEEW